MLTQEKVAAFVLAAVLIALPVAFVVYSFMAPLNAPGTLFFLSATGGGPQDNAHKVVVGGFYERSCQVVFESALGSTDPITYDPCKFSFNTPAGSSASLQIESVKRGLITSEVSKRPRSGDSTKWGFEGYDSPHDSIDWWAINVREGQTLKVDINGWGCATNGYCGAGEIIPLCSSKADGPRTGCTSGSSATYYHSIDRTNIWRDTSDTFQLSFGNRFTFEIVNDNFYASEAVARDNISSYPHLRELDCPIKPGYMLGVQDFAAGSTVALDSFAFPVNFFCKSLPVIVLDTNGKQIKSTPTPYQQLLQGGSVRIPDGEVWEFFYILRVTDDVPIVCSPVEVAAGADGLCPSDTTVSSDGRCYQRTVYDGDKNKCVIKPGIVHLCRDGIYDPMSLSCVTYPDTHVVCPPMTTYDTSIEACVYIPPVQAVCPRNDSIYDGDLDKCVYYPDRIAICPPDTVYDKSLDMCRYTPPIKYSCPLESGGNTLSMIDRHGVKYCWYKYEYGDANGTVYKIECDSPFADDGTGCYREADKEYEPCVEGYVSVDPGVCVRVPEYSDEVTCPPGYVFQDNVCLSDAAKKVDCDPNYHYDSVQDKCVAILPAEAYCIREGGTWGTDGKCYKTPNSYEDGCPTGFEYIESRKACIMYRPLEETYICIQGTLNPLTLKCEIPGEAEVVEPIKGTPVCDKGQWDTTLKKCVTGVETTIVTVEDEEAAQQTTLAFIIGGITLGAMLAGIAYLIFTRLR